MRRPTAPSSAAGAKIWPLAKLKRRKYRILDRNVRVGRGELDIVATDRDAIVFIEVKTRRDQTFGGARAALTHTKARQLARLAQTYLRQHPDRTGDYRIDVVAIDVDPSWQLHGGCDPKCRAALTLRRRCARPHEKPPTRDRPDTDGRELGRSLAGAAATTHWPSGRGCPHGGLGSPPGAGGLRRLRG